MFLEIQKLAVSGTAVATLRREATKRTLEQGKADDR